MEALSLRLREERERLGLSQEAFAALGGQKRLSQTRYERGERVPDSNYLAALSRAGVDVHYVLTGRRSEGGAPDPLTPGGHRSGQTARTPGFCESDAEPFRGPDPMENRVGAVARMLGARAGVDVWKVRSTSMALAGYMPGDFILVDTRASVGASAGDVVVAQIYDDAAGTATTVLRRFEPPVLVSASQVPDDLRVLVVDGEKVAIRGKVIASWRM
ncbi:MAG: helix-turn-helix domain-containing protein [Albidovulum sp.]|uniref:helix-turn-helix domain-containing protein n=1 Tax=Albidovulum sp. TaxID=1872424 RepID=UPI003C835101